MSTTTADSALPRLRRRWKVLHARKGWHLAIRVVEWTVGVVLGVWLLYIVVANAMLSTHWARHKVNSTPQVLQVDYATAWTVLPGIFHMTKVAGWGQFTSFEYSGQIDELSINVGLTALLHHKVALDIRAHGVALQGKPPKSVKAADPVIAAPVPLYQVAAPPVPVVDESLAKWTITVDLEITGGREIWVDAVRYEGPVEAKGSMSTTPNRSFEVRSFRVEAENGQVFVGPKTALPRLQAGVEVKLDPVDPRGVDFGAFRRLTVDATLGGTLGEMSFVQDIDPTLPVKFAGDGGRFGIRARLEHGQLMAPGLARVENDGIWVGFAGTGVRGAVEAEGRLEASPDGPVAHLTAEVRRGEVTTAKGGTFVVMPVTRSRATASHLDLSNPKSMRFTFGAQVPEAVVPHLSVINEFMTTSKVRVTGGEASSSGTIEGDFPKGALDGWVTFHTDPPLEMAFDGTRLKATLMGRIPVVRASSHSDFVLTGAAVHAVDTYLDNGDEHTTKWWGDVDVPKGQMHFKGGARYTGSFHATFRDIDPVITAISKLHGVPSWVNRMLGIGPYVADATGTFGKETRIELIDTRATAEKFPTHPHTRVRATYDGTRDPPSWMTEIDFGVLALGLEKSRGHLGFQLIDVGEWFDRRAGLAPVKRD